MNLGIAPWGGLYYMRNRWYEPGTGRFLSEDPIGLEGGINPYTFAGNDPVNGRDPSGLKYTCAWESVETVTGGDTREQWVCHHVELGGFWDFSGRFSEADLRGFGGLSEYGLWEAPAGAGPFEETEVRFNKAWIGCGGRSRNIQFWSTDKQGQRGAWNLRRMRVAGGRVKVRGIPIDGRVGFYQGNFWSPSYVTPLRAYGQVLCGAGIGLFEAGLHVS